MGIRINWSDTNTAEDGYNVYRSLTSMAGLDPANLPPPLAQLPADATEYKDGTAVDGETYFYLVATRSGSELVRGTEVEITAADTSGGGGADYSTAQIGDEIGGGIYAGIDTIGGTDYHIVSGKAESEAYGLQWKTSRTATAGTDSNADGLANTNAMVAAGITDHPAAQHCVNYSGGGNNDWHMPALSQLRLMYNNLASHAEFAELVSSGNYTWASTENSVLYAGILRFSQGDEFYGSKDNTNTRVRPIRRVAV